MSVAQQTETQTQIMRSIISNVISSLLKMEKVNLVDKYNYLAKEMQVQKIHIGSLEFETALEKQVSLINLILTQYAFET